jgi:transcriptional regulator with XRE-family HTH domain
VGRSIGIRLRHLRGAQTLSGMAALMGVCTRTYAYYERGQRVPDAYGLAALYAHGWNINWLLSGEGAVDVPAMEASALTVPRLAVGHTGRA